MIIRVNNHQSYTKDRNLFFRFLFKICCLSLSFFLSFFLSSNVQVFWAILTSSCLILALITHLRHVCACFVDGPACWCIHYAHIAALCSIACFILPVHPSVCLRHRVLDYFRHLFSQSRRVPIPYHTSDCFCAIYLLHFSSLRILFRFPFSHFSFLFMSSPAFGCNTGAGTSRSSGPSREICTDLLFTVNDLVPYYRNNLDSWQFAAMWKDGKSTSVGDVRFQCSRHHAVGVWKKTW